jgi:hypothetical protein
MPLTIIDNKRVNMTDAETQLYRKIVISYTNLTNKGEDLFIDLFEVDGSGNIIFLKPPSKRQTSFEVYLFLMTIMVQQQQRIMNDTINDVCNQMKNKMKEIDDKLEELSKK